MLRNEYIVEELHRQIGVFRVRAQQCHKSIRWQTTLLSFIEQRRADTAITLRKPLAQQRMIGQMGLYQHLALLVAATGATGDLGQQLGGFFWAAKVGVV